MVRVEPLNQGSTQSGSMCREAGRCRLSKQNRQSPANKSGMVNPLGASGAAWAQQREGVIGSHTEQPITPCITPLQGSTEYFRLILVE